MAKAKKTAALTLEERLEQALVPEGEQPYSVPENWCWTRVGALVDTSKEKKDDFSDADVKYIGLEHMEKNGGIINYSSSELIKSLKNVFHSNQILYGKLRPYLNKHDIATFDGVCSTDILVFSSTKASIPSFINFFFDQRDFIEYVVTNSKGINLPRVSENVILQAACPLPPLPEQQRIVDRIESLFAKLDEAKEKAQAALDSFAIRKAAILHKAFTGELTAKWREENGVGSWEYKELIDVSEKIFDGPFGSNLKSDDYVSAGVRVVRLENLKHLWFDNSKQSFVTNEKYDTIKQHTIYPSDLIMSTFIADEVKICEMPNEINFAVNKADCIGIRLRINMNKLFIMYYLASNTVYENLFKQIHGATRPRVNSKQIKGIRIPIPMLAEQNQIADTISRLLKLERQSQESCVVVIDKIDLIKKSILARAFRGALGTNDPDEESAVELLKSII